MSNQHFGLVKSSKCCQIEINFVRARVRIRRNAEFCVTLHALYNKDPPQRNKRNDNNETSKTMDAGRHLRLWRDDYIDIMLQR